MLAQPSGVICRMKKISVNAASNAQLNWMVARAKGLSPDAALAALNNYNGTHKPFSPTTDAEQAFEIISDVGIDTHQRKQRPFARIDVRHFDPGQGDTIQFDEECQRDMVLRPQKPRQLEGMWFARLSIDHNPFGWQVRNCPSPTMPIAAMRAYVTATFGQNVEVPHELV